MAIAAFLRPALTTVGLPVGGLAKAAVGLAAETIEDPGAPPRTVVVPMEFTVRESG